MMLERKLLKDLPGKVATRTTSAYDEVMMVLLTTRGTDPQEVIRLAIPDGTSPGRHLNRIRSVMRGRHPEVAPKYRVVKFAENGDRLPEPQLWAWVEDVEPAEPSADAEDT